MSVAETLQDVLALISGDVTLLKAKVAQSPRSLGIEEQRGLTAYARVLSEIAEAEKDRKPPGDMTALLERAAKIPELRDLIMRTQKPAPTRGGEDD